MSGEELSGEIVLADGEVGFGEEVAVEAEGAKPDLGLVIDASVGVQNGAAFEADDGVVGENWEVGGVHQWRAHDGEWEFERVRLRRSDWPRIPCPAKPLDRFQFRKVHFGLRLRFSDQMNAIGI